MSSDVDNEVIYNSKETLGTKDSPIVIEQELLIKDKDTGRLAANIKFRDVSDTEIRSLKIGICPLNYYGDRTGDITGHLYDGLSVKKNECIGETDTIAIPEIAAKSFYVIVQEICFADGRKISLENSEWYNITLNDIDENANIPLAINDIIQKVNEAKKQEENGKIERNSKIIIAVFVCVIAFAILVNIL